MKGKNLFEAYQLFGRATGTIPDCIFISHSSKDKEMAILVSEIILAMGVDIYFDKEDSSLQSASATGNDAGIVKCIDDGLGKSTHLLGLITNNTFESWWVPYEIGSAKGRNKVCGHLVASEVKRLPSYVKVAPLLLDIDDLVKWLPGGDVNHKGMIKEAMSHQTNDLRTSYISNFRLTIPFY